MTTAERSSMRPAEWLRQALGLRQADTPFPWQEALLARFANGMIDRSLDIPTGLGKTSVMGIWLVARACGAWLPTWGAVGTTASAAQGPEDTTVVRPPVKAESARARRIREGDERIGWVRGLPKSAAEALRTAMRWQAEIEANGIRQADIARRERITRARVTQMMSLLDLPEDLKAMLLAGDPEIEDWGIRRALHEVG